MPSPDPSCTERPTLRPARRRLARVCVLGLWLGAPAAAQFSQYVGAGTFEETPESLREQIELAMQESRWRWGRFYVDPWAGLRELTYDDNVGARAEDPQEETVSDYAATVGAGLRFYTPIGRGLVWSAHLLPEYVWWDELSERRRLNGRYGVGLFGTVDRLAIEAFASRVEDSRFFSREFEDQVNVRDDDLEADFEVSLGGGFGIRGLGRLERLRLQEEEEGLAPLRALDRDERTYRGGLRYHFPSGLYLGAGAEDSEVDFEQFGSVLLDNSGRAPYAEFFYDGPQLFLLGDVVARAQDFEQAPQLDFEELTGRLRVAFEIRDELQPQLFANRNLAYSISERWAYFEDTGFGAALLSEATPWLIVRGFGEVGTNDYRPIVDPLDLRCDEFETYGVDLQFVIGPLNLIVAASRTVYDSTLPEFDRTVELVRTGVVWGPRSVSPW